MPALERILRQLLELVLGECAKSGAARPAGVSRRKARRLAGLDEELLEKSNFRTDVSSSVATALRWAGSTSASVSSVGKYTMRRFGTRTICVLVAKEFAL